MLISATEAIALLVYRVTYPHVYYPMAEKRTCRADSYERSANLGGFLVLLNIGTCILEDLAGVALTIYDPTLT